MTGTRMFIFGSAFDVYNMLLDIEFVFKNMFPIVRVNLLAENHYNDKFKFKFVVNIYSDICSCVNDSDYVLIIKNENTPLSNIGMIENLCGINGKKLDVIDSPWNICSPTSHIDIGSEMKTIYKSCPVILNVSIGKCTQSTHVEFLLHQIFQKKDVRVCQFFTKAAAYLNSQINDDMIKNLYANKNFDMTGYDVVLNSYVFENEICLYEDMDKLKQLYPDIIILEIENGIADIEYLNDLFRYNLRAKIDIVIISRYKKIGEKLCYCEKNNFPKIPEMDFFDIENESLMYNLEEIIFSKIAFPSGIVKF